MRRYLAALAAPLLLALALGACSTVNAIQTAANTPVSATEISNAKAVSFGLESSYDAVLTVAIAWGSQPICGAPGSKPVPFCATYAGILQAEKARQSVRTALNALNAAIASTTTTSSQLSAAVAAAQQTYGAYQQVLAIYNIKPATTGS